jgi:multidrug efflux pump subunit AcrA (membrane-fusion protein)
VKKWISIVVILVLVAGGVWFYQNKQTDAATPSTEVMTSTVQRGDIEVSISGSGSVASINSNDVTSSSEGIVDEVLVAENTIVAEGDELITFTDGSDPVIAPHAGTITTLNVESGDRVQSGTVVSHITDYATLQTVITVDELDITSIESGQAANITVNAFPDDTFAGKVTKVANEGTAESGVSSFEVTVQFDEPREVLIGMSTEVSITTESNQDVLYVPIEAVKVDRNQKYVTVQETSSNQNEEEPTTKQVVVETGINDDKNIEITSGVEEGQIIQLTLQVSTTTIQSTEQRAGMRGMGGAESGFPSGGQGRMTPPTGGTGRGGE